jgi:hypothetical protein
MPAAQSLESAARFRDDALANNLGPRLVPGSPGRAPHPTGFNYLAVARRVTGGYHAATDNGHFNLT